MEKASERTLKKAEEQALDKQHPTAAPPQSVSAAHAPAPSMYAIPQQNNEMKYTCIYIVHMNIIHIHIYTRIYIHIYMNI